MSQAPPCHGWVFNLKAMIEIKPNEYNAKKGKYIGVGFDKQVQKFKARIRYDGKTHHLGTFKTELEGAKEYDRIVKLNGIDTRLNFPEPEPKNLNSDAKLIRLDKGLFAQVDEEDFEYLNQFRWHAAYGYSCYYAVRTVRAKGKRATVGMARVILGLTDPKLAAEHEDRNGLNNRRYNLRIATNQENSINQVGCNKTSQYKGVHYDKERGKYIAQIKINYKTTHLGRYSNEMDAAKAYDKKAKEVFGEFAYLNFLEVI